MARFRVYAIGGIKYVDIDDPAVDDVEDLYRKAARAGYVAGIVEEEEKPLKVLIPARGIGVITDALD